MKKFIILMLAPRYLWDEAFNSLENQYKGMPNAKVADLPVNPVSLLLLFKKLRGRIRIIAPQYHVILSAHIAGVSYFPIVYDNKVGQLFDEIGVKHRIHALDKYDVKLQSFISEANDGIT